MRARAFTRSSLRALEQYRRGIQTAVSRVDAEEHALDQLGGLMIRARELATRYASDTADADARRTGRIVVEGLLRQAVALGDRLRRVRLQQGLSLQEVEATSAGALKASVVGAYERGFRTLSLPRLRSLADFYRVPVAVLLGEPTPMGDSPEQRKIVLDLEALGDHPLRSAAAIRAELGVPTDRLLAVMVGNVRHWKGQHVVVEALGHLPPALRDRLTVLLVGDISALHRDYADSVQRRAAELGISDDTLRWVGRRTDIPDLLEAVAVVQAAGFDAVGRFASARG